MRAMLRSQSDCALAVLVLVAAHAAIVDTKLVLTLSCPARAIAKLVLTHASLHCSCYCRANATAGLVVLPGHMQCWCSRLVLLFALSALALLLCCLLVCALHAGELAPLAAAVLCLAVAAA